jgi:hypothetical protein
MTPLGKGLGALLTTLATAQLSAVVGEPRATPLAVHEPGSVLAVTLAGQMIDGGVVSFTVTVAVQELEAP